MTTIYRITPKSSKALEWLKENLIGNDYQWRENKVFVSDRLLELIIENLFLHGFRYERDFFIDL